MDLKLIYEPTVYLVGRQAVVESEVERFLQSIDAAEWSSDAESPGETLIEIASRGCYQSFKKPRPGGNKAHIEHILEVGHGSVLEAGVWSLLITGVSRSLTHELVRHRVGIGISEMSQRFIDCSEVAFVVPPLILEETIDLFDPERFVESGDDIAIEWRKTIRESLEAYGPIAMNLEERILGQMMPPEDPDMQPLTAKEYKKKRKTFLDNMPQSTKTWLRKTVREAARSVLPNATETKIFITANSRALRHLIELRGSEHADAEFRRLARVILSVMRKEAPTVFGDYEEDGMGIRTEHKKV